MQGKSNRIFLNVLMILALIGAGISPACKFISGQSWMEICGVAGMEKILVAADQIPSGDEKNQEIKESCAFCFFGSHIKPLATALIEIPTPIETAQRANHPSPDTIVQAAAYRTSFPRGPPILL